MANEVNKIKFGLTNVHYAPAEIAADGTAEYETPVRWPGAVSIGLDPEGDNVVFYADNIAYWTGNGNNGYNGDLEIARVIDSFRTDILGDVVDAKGVIFENTEAPIKHFALLFEFDGDVNAIRHVLYNCAASRPSIESETKEDTIEPGTETLSLTADPREDGLVKSRTGDTTDATTYANWYKSVYLPAAAQSGASGGNS